jgi:hypothetical protein
MYLVVVAVIDEVDISRRGGGDRRESLNRGISGQTGPLSFSAGSFCGKSGDMTPIHLGDSSCAAIGILSPHYCPIDILALDDSGAFVVIELKRARSPDHAIGQLARYMGWVKQTIGRDRSVRGVVVGKTISEGLRYAVSVIPDVSLFEYEVSFQLRPIEETKVNGAV